MKPFVNWWRPFAGLAFCLIYPSTAIFKKLGYALLSVYILAALLLLFFSISWLVPRLMRIIASDRQSLCILFLAFAFVLVAFLAIHPKIDTQGFQLAGRAFGSSDGDDAIDLVIMELRDGRYPYTARTFLGNPITPMPGAALLAVPFYLLGNSALQNIFWLFVFMMLVMRYYHSAQLALILAILIFLFSPNVLYNIFQGGDYLANSIYLIAFSALLCESVRCHRPGWQSGLWAILFGIGLSSRPNFVLLLPLVFMAIVRLSSWRRGAALLAVTLATVGTITLPFVIVNPSGFSPLHTSAKLSLEGRFPWAPVVVPALGLIFAVGLALRRREYALPILLKKSFFVQAFVIMAGAVLTGVHAGRPDLQAPHFGVLFMFFGIFAFGPDCLIESGALRADSRAALNTTSKASSADVLM